MNRSGQTLIEVIIAASVIVVGIISLISLLVTVQTTGADSQDELVAIQLGREAIEAARFVRDSNWLAQENGQTVSYNDSLHNATDYSAVYTWDPSKDPVTGIIFNFAPDSISNPSAKVYQAASGLYRQRDGLPLSAWTVTPYTRFITFYPICSSDLGVTESVVSSDGSTCGATPQIGVQVQVTVQWTSRGNAHTRTFEERLYNWKYGD